MEEPVMKPCPDCDGTGECTDCHGNCGEECPSCGHWEDCDTCGGSGACFECEGTGEIEEEG